MASQNPFEDRLFPLTNLAARVEEFAALCLPDFSYSIDVAATARFEQYYYEEADETMLALTLIEGDTRNTHVFNRWSYSQLLSNVGVRPKWFNDIKPEIAAEELNLRLRTMYDHRFRRMRSFDENGPLILRGTVSKHYADIPDTEIMKAIVALQPEGKCLRWLSDKTDRALYVYVMSDNKIHIPNTNLSVWPGVVVKNSEVGYTSLWVIPFIYNVERSKVAVMEKKAVVRKVHRGDANDLSKLLQEALEKTTAIWADMRTKIPLLVSISWPTEDIAIGVMSRLVDSCGGTKGFASKCETAYRAAKHTTHNALCIVEALLGHPIATTPDDEYDAAAIAGGVLLKLADMV